MKVAGRNVKPSTLTTCSFFWQVILPPKASPEPLAFFRIGVSLIALLQVLLIFPYLKQLYGNFGLIQWTIMETEGEPFALSIGKLGYLLYQWGISANTTLYFVFGAYIIFLTGLLTGWHKRIMTVGTWFTHLLIVNAGNLSMYGVDSLLHTCLFYCMVMPVGDAWSLDQLLSKKPVKQSFYASVSIRILQCHLCIIYLNTGLAKCMGIQWWNGEAIWRALMMPKFAVLDFSWLARFPLVAVVIGISVMILETAYMLMIWPKISRKFWLTGIILIHAGIGLFMGLSLFSAIMIWMNLSSFGFTVYPIEQSLKRLTFIRKEKRKEIAKLDR